MSQFLRSKLDLALLFVGLCAECGVGGLFFLGPHLIFFLLHAATGVLFCWGVQRVTAPNRSWAIVALLLCAASFPGFGACACSIALLVARSAKRRPQQAKRKDVVTEPLLPIEVSPSLDWVVQPLVDTLYQDDLEARRTSVAALGRQATPDANRLLRELLADPQPEVRSDASIALTRMEEQLAHELNSTFERWVAQPENQERTEALADQYYAYATSNILDRQSQRSYLQKAYELLQQLVERNQEVAKFWYKLARVRYAMGELSEALQAAQKALTLQPDYPEATTLAMDVAFRQRSWNRLLAYGGNILENSMLDWWNNSEEEVKHGKAAS